MEEQNAAAEYREEPLPDSNEVWRNEVQERVAGYRTRRGRRIEGAFSMRFPFPPVEAPTVSSEPEVMAAECDLAGSEAEHLSASPWPADAIDAAVECRQSSEDAVALARDANDTAADQECEVAPLPARRTKPKVIAFPRPVIAEVDYYREEPVVPEQPRILDVPAEPANYIAAPANYLATEPANYPTTLLLDGLQFPSHQQASVALAADHVELPHQAASLAQRLYAGVIDCTLVAAAAAAGIAAGYKFLPRLPLTKPLLLAFGAVPVLLWAAYQYLFIMYGGWTVGMRVAGIRLSSFKGGTPRWRQRRSRVIALYFSTASLMMGLLWVLVDVDMLCWHDRISRTYLTSE